MRTRVTPLIIVFCLVPFLISFQGSLITVRADRFAPSHRLAGIGVERAEMPDDLLALRTDLMIQSQTFAIMREAESVAGAQRISGPRLQALFRSAERDSGFPASTLAAISYLESWGSATAESPAGPKGIMQISEATARSMGLGIGRSTRYKTGPPTK